ncbi:hypothetical protein L1987_64721 [Smallanthus sonchifolius]|uniref:Uncharacterized protein n=1 Tax=Smallanthus sonchifolius TaxID=185202 RepID=A0ACB9BSI4_9ASTR|nr:hypothetical protein L1987_64721 [Smallanthus sonchifolius]
MSISLPNYHALPPFHTPHSKGPTKLIVLDEIDKHEQLCALLGTKAFPTQSKIIITTEHLDINAWLDSISWPCRVHNIKLLDDRESLELLFLYAFRSKIPMEGFKELAVQLARYCEGHPLARKVLGSSLAVSNEQSSRRNYMIEIWRSRMKSFNLLKGNLDSNIQDALKRAMTPCHFLVTKSCFCILFVSLLVNL